MNLWYFFLVLFQMANILFFTLLQRKKHRIANLAFHKVPFWCWFSTCFFLFLQIIFVTEVCMEYFWKFLFIDIALVFLNWSTTVEYVCAKKDVLVWRDLSKMHPRHFSYTEIQAFAGDQKNIIIKVQDGLKKMYFGRAGVHIESVLQALLSRGVAKQTMDDMEAFEQKMFD